MRTIEFWLEYASTYSYLSVSRIGRMADERGIAIDWQPFWLHPVRERQGLPAPFPDGSPRERYMWRDLERRARLLGLPYRRPATYPFNSVGQDLDRVLAAASAPETKEAFKQQATRALERGIFGSPGFVVDGGLFWGDDRLEDALAHAAA